MTVKWSLLEKMFCSFEIRFTF